MTDEILDTPEKKGNLKDLEGLIRDGYEFKFGEYIQEGWDLARANLGIFVAYTLVFFVIVTASSFIPFGTILVVGPLTVGYYIAANRIKYGQKLEFKDFFKGFDHFVPLLLATLIMGIFQFLGFILLIIPGIYLAVAYTIVYLIIVFHKIDFWEAMEFSRKVVTKKWWTFFGFAIVLGLINLLGVIALGVGVLITIPITMCATFAAFHDIAGTENYDGPPVK